jgi:hypothetical protein
MKFVKDTEQYDAKFRISAVSHLREETGKSEKSYKGQYMYIHGGELQECTHRHGHSVSWKQSCE